MNPTATTETFPAAEFPTRRTWYRQTLFLRARPGVTPEPLAACNGHTDPDSLQVVGVMFRGYAAWGQGSLSTLFRAYVERLGYEVTSTSYRTGHFPDTAHGHYYQFDPALDYLVHVNAGPLHESHTAGCRAYTPEVDRRLIPYVQALREQQ